MSGELTLVNKFSGEALAPVDAQALLSAAGLDDLPVAETVDLAAFAVNSRELQSIADEARNVVSGELIRRLDRDGCWTWRESGYEVKAPSPEAGTTRYHTGLLREALTNLVADGVISPAGAEQAVGRHEDSVAVRYDLLETIRRLLDDVASEVTIDAELWDNLTGEIGELLADRPAPSYHQRPSGIRNLLRIPAAKAAIEACRLPATPPPRVARVRKVNR